MLSKTLLFLTKMKLIILLIISLCIVSSSALPKLKTQSLSDGRIIGGTPAHLGQFPWQVVIYFDTDYGSFLCGGALIDPKWVLTSAHCVYGATSFYLILGTTSLDESGVTVETESYVSHPDYNPETFENDVGLVRIDGGVEVNDNIQTIALATSDLQSNVDVTVSGWGASSSRKWRASGTRLNYVNLATISNNECKSSYGMLISDQMVCAMGNRNNGICVGDSGSPLITQSNGKSVHVGVTTWSSASGCDTSQPSAYTRTASYRNWIMDVVSDF